MVRRSVRYARQAVALLCAAAVGALLFSVRVATAVFADMPDDRLLAGRIAGRAFVGAYAIALAAAALAIVVTFATGSRRGNRVLACVLGACAAMELFWIAPAIVMHGAGWPWTFASLHAVGGVVHLSLAVLSLILAWRMLAD